METLQDRLARLIRAREEGEGEAELSYRWSPRVDIYEDEEAIEIHFELPGFTKEEIDIEVGSEVLTVSGERKPPDESIRSGYTRIERLYGPFSRSFTLPDRVDASKISARYEEGILKLALPKSEKAKPRKISVEIG